jgi:hypothetical protein
MIRSEPDPTQPLTPVDALDIEKWRFASQR